MNSLHREEPGGVAYIVEEMRVPTNEGVLRKSKTRFIYNLVTAPGCYDTTDMADVFNSVRTLREVMIRDGRDKVAVAGGTIRDDVLGKVLEYIFASSGVEVLLLCGAGGRPPDVLVGRESKSTRGPTAKKGPRDNAVLVKPGVGRSYAELLREVRGRVDLAGSGTEVTGVRKTRDGDLLLSVKKKPGQDHVDALAKEIESKVAGVKTIMMRDKPVLIHVNGLDEVSTADELAAAVAELLPNKGQGITVKRLWPAYGGAQNAAITASKTDADVLLRSGRVKVGRSWCRHRQRKDVPTCYRCWENGHSRSSCRGPDRSRLCLKCGKEGHVAKNCAAELYCPICDKGRHKAMSTGCPVFRRALSRVSTKQ